MRGYATAIASVLVVAAWAAGAPAQEISPAAAADARARFRTGQEAFRSGRLAEAEQAFVAALRLDPGLAAARCALGQTYMALKQYGSAVETLTDCKSLTQAQAQRALASVVEKEQQRDDEIRELRDAIRRIEGGQLQLASPDTTITRLQARIQDLEAQKVRGLGGASLPAEIPFALGTALLRVGSLEGAEQELLEAVKARPGYGEAHNNLAAVYVGSGRWTEAEEHLALAEKSGFKVSPQLRADVEERRSSLKAGEGSESTTSPSAACWLTPFHASRRASRATRSRGPG